MSSLKKYLYVFLSLLFSCIYSFSQELPECEIILQKITGLTYSNRLERTIEEDFYLTTDLENTYYCFYLNHATPQIEIIYMTPDQLTSMTAKFFEWYNKAIDLEAVLDKDMLSFQVIIRFHNGHIWNQDRDVTFNSKFQSLSSTTHLLSINTDTYGTSMTNYVPSPIFLTIENIKQIENAINNKDSIITEFNRQKELESEFQ